MARLSDVCEINPRFSPLSSDDNELASFVPMASVSEVSGSIFEGQVRPVASLLKGFTPFRDRDVLVAKITPCFENGKIAHARISHRYGFGSTEFHVLRPDPAKVDDRYLFHFMRQPWVRAEGEKRMTGSGGQRRVPRQFLEDLYLPTPSLSEQRRIAAILDKADALRVKRRESIVKLDQLLQSVFLDMFGDPMTNPRDFKVMGLGEVARQVTDGAHHTPIRQEQGIPLLSARNVLMGSIDFSNTDFVGQDEYERLRKRCEPLRGDILISCSGSIGRVAVVSTDAHFVLVRSAALVKLKTEVVAPYFVEYQLRTPFLQAQMERSARSSSQANLFQKPIRELQIVVPPLAQQHRFESLAGEVEARRNALIEAEQRLSDLFASLQSAAFQGKRLQ